MNHIAHSAIVEESLDRRIAQRIVFPLALDAISGYPRSVAAFEKIERILFRFFNCTRDDFELDHLPDFLGYTHNHVEIWCRRQGTFTSS